LIGSNKYFGRIILKPTIRFHATCI